MNYPIHIRIQDESEDVSRSTAHAADPRIPNTDNDRNDRGAHQNHPLVDESEQSTLHGSGIPNIGEYPGLADLLKTIEKTINEHHGDDRSTLHDSDIPNTDTDVPVDPVEEDESDEAEDFFRHTSVTEGGFIPNMEFFQAVQPCEFTNDRPPEDPDEDDIPNTEPSRPVYMIEDYEDFEDLLEVEIDVFGILEPRDIFVFTENGVMIRTSVEFRPKKMAIVMRL